MIRAGKIKGPYVGVDGTPVTPVDEKVKVSGVDTTAGFLTDKLLPGSGITLTPSGAGNETLTIAAPGSTTDEKVKASPADTTPGYLYNDKIQPGTNMSSALAGAPGDEYIVLSAADPTVKASPADTTPGYLYNDKIQPGTNMSSALAGAPGDEYIVLSAADPTVKVSAGDTTAARLESKVLPGTGITVTKENAGGNEDLKIACTVVNTDELVKATAGDTTGEYLSTKLTGSGCTISTVGAAGTNQKTLITVAGSTDINAKVSAADTATSYLNTKITVGTGLTKSITSPGGDERLNIALTTAQPTKFRHLHSVNPDSMDIEGGASVTDYVSTSNSNRFRIVELPEGSDVHFSIAMHPKYDGGTINCKAHWVVVDGSHGTTHDMEYNARMYRNTDSLDINETERTWTIQADSASDLLYIDSKDLTVEGTYAAAGTLLHFRLAHKSDCAASGSLKLLVVEISYLCTLE